MNEKKITGTSPVLVVGAGPAGSAAGIVLARAGADVCVVDRARFPRDKTCGDAVSSGAMALCEELGAADAIKAGPHALVNEGAIVFPDGTRISRRYDKPGYIVPRLALDHALRLALSRSCARVIEEVQVSELVRRDGAVTGAVGTDFSWQSPLVIAADGPASVGLQALGRTLPRGPHLAVSATLYMRGVQFPAGADVADHIFDRTLPYGYGWIFPSVDGVSNVGVYQRSDAYARGGISLSALLAAFLARHPERFAAASPVGKQRVWSLPLAPPAWPMSGPGLLLAGDAGGFVDPLSGEGIWQALFTGRLAGAVAAEAIERGSLSPGLRARYELTCVRRIGAPSVVRRAAQRGLTQLVERGHYRSAWLQRGLRLAYTGHIFEMTKKR